jgi:hypothetical protein
VALEPAGAASGVECGGRDEHADRGRLGADERRRIGRDGDPEKLEKAV